MRFIKKLLLIIPIIFLFNVNVKAEEPKITESYNRWGIILTDEEVDLMARILKLEDGNDESIDARYAIVETVFNRIYCTQYPNTLEEVLSQPGQFSTWRLRNSDRAYPRAEDYLVVYGVMYGMSDVLDYDVLYFNNVKIGYEPQKIGKMWFGKQKNFWIKEGFYYGKEMDN